MTKPVAEIARAASRRSKRADEAAASEYSARLAALAGFTLRHKTLVVGAWLAVAVALAVLFPQLEAVVRKQSVDLIPRRPVVPDGGPHERGVW